MNSAPYLSIVIPAYNEERRLPKTLERLFSYLGSLNTAYEIIVVDDGSRDGTVAFVTKQMQLHPELRLISDGVNRGRGAAVKRGISEARGELILESDSDGSVADEAIGRFIQAFKDDPELDAAFGSRELPDSKIVVWQPLSRVILGYGFLFLARGLFMMWHVTDFTLGFRMFRRAAAHRVYAHQYDHYYVAEAEKVFATRQLGFKSIELPVVWTDDPDSRIKPFRDTLRSLWGLWCVLWRFVFGRYSQ